jgi:hypothetical protein
LACDLAMERLKTHGTFDTAESLVWKMVCEPREGMGKRERQSLATTPYYGAFGALTLRVSGLRVLSNRGHA